MPSKILNFNKDRLITGINIIDGMLFFTDDHTEPKKINIEKFKGNFDEVTVDHSSGTTNIYGRPFEERDITVIKEHPKKALNSDLQSNIIDVGDDDGGGGDILVDGDLTWTGFEISKSLDTIFKADGDTLQKLSMHGSVSTITPLSEIGFYYTFDESLIDNAASISANLNNGVYKISGPEAISGDVELSISNDPTNVNYEPALANVSNGDKIFYVLYAIEAGGTGDPVFAIESNGDLDIVNKTIGDATSQPIGVISDLEVNVQVTSLIGSKRVTIEATYSKDSYVRVQQNGFLISAERIAGSGEGVPTATEVRNEIRDQEGGNIPIYTDDDGTKSLFPKALNNSAADNDGRFFPEQNIDASRLTTGSIYYVYAYVDTENSTQGRVYSAVPGIIEISADVSNEAPSLYHKLPGTAATYVSFEAHITNAGSNATLSERGFIFSTVENDLNNIKTLTFSPTTYQATGSGAPSNTYKVPVPITPGTNGLNEDYSLFTNTYNGAFFNNGALNTNETVYYVAYATNDRGQTAYAPQRPTVGSAVGGSLTLGQGLGMDRVTTVANVEPKISINHFTTYKLNSDRHRVLSLGFDIDAIPDSTKVDAIGLVYAYPSGDSPEYGINETNIAASGVLNGFHKENDGYNKIDNSPTSVTIESSQFTYTGSDPNNQIGNYTIQYNTRENVNTEDDLRYKELFPESYFGPFNAGFSYYAYIIYDGQKYFSNIRTGAFAAIFSSTGSGFTTGNCTGQRLGPPTMWFGGVDPAKTHLPENPTTSVTLYASMCPNANRSNNALLEMGFYWSYEKIEGTSVNQEKLEEWAAKPSTNKVTIPVTSTQPDPRGSGNVQATNWTSIVTGTNGAELYGEKKFHLETTITIPAGKEGKYIYWTPFNLMHRTGLYNLGLAAQRPVPIKFGRGIGYGESLASVQIGKTITSIDVEPTVVINRIDANASYPNFVGKANANSQNYTISKKGFYYKPSTSFSSSAEADVKTEMASPTNRTQLSGLNLPKGVDYSFKPTSALANGTYYVSAFCEIIIGGTTYTRISNNYKSITINVSTDTTLNTTPELKAETYSGQVQMNGRITKNTSDIVTKGFYVIKKQGQNSISLTRTGAGLKSVFDNPPAGVTATNEVSNTAGSYFSKSISSFQKGYTYIYAAYATNSKGETGISNNVTELFISDNTPSKIETVPSNYNTVYVDSEGYPCSDSSFNRPVLGGDLFIEIATEKNTADNWRIKSTQKWSGSNISPRVTKRLKNGTYFLNIGRQRVNQTTYQTRAGVTLENTTDITKQLRIEIIQQGVGTGFNDNVDNLDWFKETDGDTDNFRY